MNVQNTLVLFPLLLGCGNPRAEFASDVTQCELAPTCAEAVACRTRAAIKHGRDPKTTVGTCEK